MEKALLISQLKEANDQCSDPYQYDGSYELVDKTVRFLSNIISSEYDISDMDTLYFMTIGTWQDNWDRKEERINKSHLRQEDKNLLIQELNNVKHRSDNMGMFGTGFTTFNTHKTPKEDAQKFLKMCVDIQNMTDVNEILNRAELVLKYKLKGIGIASTSQILHCLKPDVFPIINRRVKDEGIKVYEILGIDLQKPVDSVAKYITNCRIIQNKNEEFNFVKNYRAFDILIMKIFHPDLFSHFHEKSSNNNHTNESDLENISTKEFTDIISTKKVDNCLHEEKGLYKKNYSVLPNLPDGPSNEEKGSYEKNVDGNCMNLFEYLNEEKGSYEKNEKIAYLLNLIFPGAGFLYLEKNLSIPFIVMTLIMYTMVKGIWLIFVFLLYNLPSLFLVANFFKENNLSTDEDELDIEIKLRKNDKKVWNRFKKLDSIKDEINDVVNSNELNMVYHVNKREYWWLNFFITGLYQARNGRKSLLIINYVLIWTFIVPAVLYFYCLYNAYNDQHDFNKGLQIILAKRQDEINKYMDNTKVEDKKDDEKEIEIIGNDFKKYEEDINYLKTQYKSKEELSKKIIREHFPPPQLTYDRFMGEIDTWREIFFKQTESTLNIIKISPEQSQKIDEELKNRINILESIVEKIDELVVELTINLGNSNKKTTVKEVKELLTEMQEVIDSVKEYN